MFSRLRDGAPFIADVIQPYAAASNATASYALELEPELFSKRFLVRTIIYLYFSIFLSRATVASEVVTISPASFC